VAKRKVYSFRMWDLLNGVNFVSKSKATREFIESIRGEILETTEEDVEEALLTADGQHKVGRNRCL
jgi:hypothetical protein